MNTKAKGNIGEEIAAKYLESLGYKVLERNVKLGGVEVDIIAKDKSTYVFIEVKTRQSNDYGMPSEAVGRAKQNRYIYAVKVFIMLHRLVDTDFRFDVIEVLDNGIENHFIAAFEA